MAVLSYYAFTAAFITLGAALLAYLWFTLGRQKQAGRFATLFTYNGAVLLGASLGARWVASGHPPYSNQFEFATSFAWGTVATYLYLESKYRLKGIGFLALAVAFGMLTYASTLPARIDPLIAARVRLMHAEKEVLLGLFPEDYQDGDADFDGAITVDDYFALDRGFLGKRIGLPNGDFNGDRAIDRDDHPVALDGDGSGGRNVLEVRRYEAYVHEHLLRPASEEAGRGGVRRARSGAHAASWNRSYPAW